MSDLSNEQISEMILFTYEQKVREKISKNLSTLLEPLASGHAHFDKRLLDSLLGV